MTTNVLQARYFAALEVLNMVKEATLNCELQENHSKFIVDNVAGVLNTFKHMPEQDFSDVSDRHQVLLVLQSMFDACALNNASKWILRNVLTHIENYLIPSMENYEKMVRTDQQVLEQNHQQEPPVIDNQVTEVPGLTPYDRFNNYWHDYRANNLLGDEFLEDLHGDLLKGIELFEEARSQIDKIHGVDVHPFMLADLLNMIKSGTIDNSNIQAVQTKLLSGINDLMKYDIVGVKHLIKLMMIYVSATLANDMVGYHD